MGGLNRSSVRCMFPFRQSGAPPMFIEKLDRHQWTLDQAKQHIAKLILAQREREAASPRAIQRPEWAKPDDPVKQSLDDARSELFTALRDGDLHATGRLSTQRRERYAAGYSRWDFHSGYHQPISPAQWREGSLGPSTRTSNFSRGISSTSACPASWCWRSGLNLRSKRRPDTRNGVALHDTLSRT